MYVAPLRQDNDALPTTTIAVRLSANDKESGWIVGELALEELWRMVDRIKVGESGRAALLSESGRLIAHGNPDKKRLVASAKGDSRIELTAAELRKTPGESRMYSDETGAEQLAVAATIPSLDWMVMVEQPKAEAFAVATRLGGQLLLVICLALAGTIVAGSLWGRSFITRILKLKRATLAIAEGRFDERVTLNGEDELKQLGDSFNSMADSIVQLQEDVRKQERQAMFGRIAAGLVHDLSHPIQNIGNSCKLIQKMFDDIEYRETFKRTVEREMVVIKRVLDDLRNIARPIPLERFPIEVDRTLAEVVESMQQHAETAGLHAARGARGARHLHRGGPLRARPRLPEPDRQRDPGDRPGRPGGRGDQPRPGAGADPRLRHRLRDPGGPPGRGVRGLRHDEAPRPRPRPGHLEKDCRTARRADLGRERSRQGHDLRPRIPEDARGTTSRSARRAERV